MKLLVTGCGSGGTNLAIEFVRSLDYFEVSGSPEDTGFLCDLRAGELHKNAATKLATESNPINRTAIVEALENFEDLRVLFMFRNPVDNCLSKIMDPWRNTKSIPLNCVDVESVNLENFDLDIDYGFFEDVTLEEASYDAVVMWNTLEHTHDPVETVMHARKALKPGGLLYIKVPEMPTVSLLRTYYDPYHFFEFNVKNLSNFLSSSGFKELHIEKLWRRTEISATEYLYQKDGE